MAWVAELGATVSVAQAPVTVQVMYKSSGPRGHFTVVCERPPAMRTSGDQAFASGEKSRTATVSR